MGIKEKNCRKETRQHLGAQTFSKCYSSQERLRHQTDLRNKEGFNVRDAKLMVWWLDPIVHRK